MQLIRRISTIVILAALLWLPAAVQAQYTFTTNSGTIMITGYTGSGGNITIPDTINGLPVTTIGSEAFYGNANITAINLSTNVTAIQDFGLDNCQSLTNVIIPYSVTNIGLQAFYGSYELQSITVDPLNTRYSSMSGVLFDTSQAALIRFPSGRAGSYAVPNGTVIITNWAFEDTHYLTRVTIADSVKTIGGSAFEACWSLNTAVIGSGVTNLGADAFLDCDLFAVFFRGNAPANGGGVFEGSVSDLRIYYLPGTTGWRATYDDLLPIDARPTVLWNPVMQTNDGNFGVQGNQFGFNVTGTTNIPIVIEATTSLVAPTWVALQNCTLTNGSLYFSDPNWVNYPSRSYRIRSP